MHTKNVTICPTYACTTPDGCDVCVRHAGLFFFSCIFFWFFFSCNYSCNCLQLAAWAALNTR
jgi:hypothetical protein